MNDQTSTINGSLSLYQAAEILHKPMDSLTIVELSIECLCISSTIKLRDVHVLVRNLSEHHPYGNRG